MIPGSSHNALRLGNVPGQSAVFFVAAVVFDSTIKKKSKSNRETNHIKKSDNNKAKPS